jgi:acyl transferase domain-containing protein/thioesterase domain-containing protein/LPS sulfotransferase NodH
MSKEAAFLETLVKEAYKKITTLERELATASQPTPPEPIAIIGMGCRFPGADTPEAYWQLLVEGRSAIRAVLPERWEPERYAALAAATIRRDAWCRGGFLDQVDQFDPLFFRISPLEARTMDPQQRLLLEVTWEALEHAALAPDGLVGSKTGVFVGMTAGQSLAAAGAITLEEAMYAGTGNTPSIAAGRLSYVLGLQGPCFALDTACSSAMMATHVAVGSLRSGECDLALAGGVNVLTPEANVLMANAGWLAADGRCKTFDAAADGHVRGEGCGIVVLKRLTDALRAGDKIWAVIRGSASNHNGRTSGLTVPNSPAQQALIRQALTNGGVQPAEVSYSEAHATGTSLGDVIEVGALGAVYANRTEPLLISSVKPNLGHLEGASGASSLMKLVLALYHGELPPHIGMQQPNPNIPWAELPIEVVTARRPWPKNPVTPKRIGGVSGFGFSGTNIHMILEEPPTLPANIAATPEQARPCHLLALSAKTAEALVGLADRYARQLVTEPTAPLADLCYTANTGRNHFTHRIAIVGATTAEVGEKLAAFAAGKRKPGLVAGEAPPARPKVAFLFSGLGAQTVGMGRQLYATAPVFRAALEQCEAVLRGQLAQPLTQVLYGADGANAGLLTQTDYAEPVLFAVEYALAMLWQAWGIKPDVVLGHSLGEYVAACVAGVLTLEEALTLVVERARLIEAASHNGATAAIFAGVEQVAQLIAPWADAVSLAGINSPEESLIAGQADAVEEVLAAAQQAGLDGKRLNVAHAAHSPLMAPVLAPLGAVAKRVSYRAPRIKFLSSVTGALCRRVDASHWQRHLREPVRFAESVAALQQTDCTLLVEIGPQPVLLWLARQNWSGADNVQWLPSLWAIHDDWKQLSQSLAELYVQGVAIDWASVYPRQGQQKAVLPTYPFQRKCYWIDPLPVPLAPLTSTATVASGDNADSETTARATAAPSSEAVSLSLAQLHSAAPAERRARILAFLQEQVAATLGLEVAAVQPTINLVEFGMDSVLAMRILNGCREALGFVLYPRDLYDRPVLQKFADYLAAEYERFHGAGALPTGESEAATSPTILAMAATRSFVAPPQKNPPMIFLLSAPRSGSTLLRVMLAGHPALFAPPELHLLWLERMGEFPQLDYLGEGLQRTLMALYNLDATASQAIIDGWVADDGSIQAIYGQLQAAVAPRLLIDKSPTYASHANVLQRIEQLFAQPKYIHLVRHPYAVIDSYVRNRMDRIGGVTGQDAFAVAEEIWTSSNQNTQTLLAGLDPVRHFTLHYEALVRDPARVMQQVADFLAVPFVQALVQPYNGARMTDGVHAGSIPLGDMNFAGHGKVRPELAETWRTIRLPRALSAATSALAQRLGYELPNEAEARPTISLPSVSPTSMGKVNGYHPPARPATASVQPASFPRSERVMTVHGLQLCLCEWGPLDGPTVVCVHGLLDHGAAWEAVAQSLAAAGYRVVAPDLRGHGHSDHVGPGSSYHFFDFVADLDAVVGELATAPVTLIGHSLGATVAACYAAARPQQIAQLILVEAYAPSATHTPTVVERLVTQLDYRAMQLSHPIFPDVAAATAQLRQTMPALSTPAAQSAAQRLTKAVPDGITWRWDNRLSTRGVYLSLPLATQTDGEEHPYGALIGQLPTPLTVVYGIASPFYQPTDKARLARTAPSAQVIDLTGTHHLHLEQPQALAQIIINHVDPQPVAGKADSVTYPVAQGAMH